MSDLSLVFVAHISNLPGFNWFHLVSILFCSVYKGDRGVSDMHLESTGYTCFMMFYVILYVSLIQACHHRLTRRRFETDVDLCQDRPGLMVLGVNQ